MIHILCATAVCLQLSTPSTHVSSAAEFRAATTASKRMTLNNLAGHKITMTPDVLSEVLAMGMRDDDPMVRVIAVHALAARAAASRSGSAEQRARADAERLRLRELRPGVLGVIASDHDPRVRRAGIIAVVNLDRSERSGPKIADLPEDFAELLAERFETDPDAGVVAEIAKTFALTTGEDVSRARVLVAGLAHRNPEVVSYSLMGLSGLKRVDVLPQIAALLRSRDRNTRLQAAQTLAAYGSHAARCIPDVQQALAAEQDPAVKATLHSTLERLKGVSSNPNTPKRLR